MMKLTSNTSIRNFIATFLKAFFIGIVFFSILLFISTNLNDLAQYSVRFDFVSMAIAILISIVSFIAYALIWHYITIQNACNINIEKAVVSWFYAEIGKYIPGKAFLLLGKMYFYEKEGQSKRKVVFSFYLETVCFLLAQALIFALSLLFVDLSALHKYTGLVYIMIGGFFICLHPRVIRILFDICARVFKKEKIEFAIKYRDILTITGLYFVNLLLIGVGYYFLVNSIYSISFNAFPFLLGTYCLAGLLGMLSVFVPSGLGVREGITVLALANILPNAVAGIVSLLTRLWTSGTELILVVLAFCYARLRKIELGRIPKAGNRNNTVAVMAPIIILSSMAWTSNAYSAHDILPSRQIKIKNTVALKTGSQTAQKRPAVYRLKRWTVEEEVDASVFRALEVFKKKAQLRFTQRARITDQNDNANSIVIEYVSGLGQDGPGLVFSSNEDFVYYLGLSSTGETFVYGMNLTNQRKFSLGAGEDITTLRCPNKANYIVVGAGSEKKVYNVYSPDGNKVDAFENIADLRGIEKSLCR